MSEDYPRDQTIGEIQRPLIFKLKSRFMLKELVAQKMHVGGCVYPVTDIDLVLGSGKMYVADMSGSGGAGTFAPAAAALTVPVGKRWRVRLMSLWQTSSVALSSCALALFLALGGQSPNVPAVASAPTVGGSTFNGVSVYPYDLLLESGDYVTLAVVVTGAATTYRCGVGVLEEDYRENVV